MTTLKEFQDNVDLHSADLSRWPESLVKPALQFMKENAGAKEYFDAALAIEDELRRYVPTEPPLEALEKRIMADVAKTPRAAPAKPAEPRVSKAWIFAPGGGLLAAAVLGFLLGLAPAPQGSGDTLVDPVFYSQDQIIGADSDADTGGFY